MRPRVEQNLLDTQIPGFLHPQGITVSPRTRSSYSTLDSKTVTLRPADAKAYAREEPAIPPPTITTSEM